MEAKAENIFYWKEKCGTIMPDSDNWEGKYERAEIPKDTRKVTSLVTLPLRIMKMYFTKFLRYDVNVCCFVTPKIRQAVVEMERS